MPEQNIQRTTQIPQEAWLSFVNQFTIVNQARRFTLEVDNIDLGNEELLQNASLASITYDASDKGNNLIISTGQPEVVYSHIVSHPMEIWVAEAESGQAIALQIKDVSDTQTILRFEV
jgi:Family of unknown function (DUF5335)